MLEADGWVRVTTKGSHRQFKHPTKKGRVTVNGSLSDNLSQFILNSIFKQGGRRQAPASKVKIALLWKR